jgi:hypothetical protein
VKFLTLMLAEHVTLNNGLINILSGGANRLGRPIFPAPLGLFLVAIVELPKEYTNGRPIKVEFSVTSPDDTEVFARSDGSFDTNLVEGAAPETATTPLVVDMRGVPLTKAGVYKVNAALEGQGPEHLYFEVLQSEMPEFSIPAGSSPSD